MQALRSDWHTDPFQFVEKDGYYYGRGTQDMKDSDAALVFTFLRLHREGYKPKRDLILALTADEEGGKFNGADWLVRQHRDLVDAAFVINPDSGGVELDHGRAVVADVEATEKVYSDYQVTAVQSRRPQLHSPARQRHLRAHHRPEQARRLHLSLRDERGHAHLLQEPGRPGNRPDCGRHDAPSSPARPTWLPPRASAPSPASTPTSAPPASPRASPPATPTTPSPQTAQANVNCRIFPGHSPEEIRQQLIGIFADPKLTVKYVSDAGVVSDTAPERKAMVPPAPIKEVFEPLTRLTQAIWPGTPVTPVMENGASDSIYFAQAGIPCYGYSAIALERDDDRAHGQDERLPVDSYWKSLDFFYSFARAVGDE